MEGTSSELLLLRCEHGQLEVVLFCARDVSIDVLFIPTIHGTNGVNAIVVKFDKVVLILEMFDVYHLDSAMIFNP